PAMGVLGDGGNQALLVENDVGHPGGLGIHGNSLIQSDSNALRGHELFAFAHGGLAEMEDAGGQHGAGASGGDAVGQVLQAAHAAGGDDGHRHGIGHGAGKFKVEAGLGAVAVHAGKQDFAGAVGGHAGGPFDGVQPRGLAAAMG